MVESASRKNSLFDRTAARENERQARAASRENPFV
jgi:hypothetical protein